MNSKHQMDDGRRLWKANLLQLGLILLAVAAYSVVLLALERMSALDGLGFTVIGLGALLLVLRRQGHEEAATEPKTPFRRWLREVRSVWLASHWDLGLITAACAGV